MKKIYEDNKVLTEGEIVMRRVNYLLSTYLDQKENIYCHMPSPDQKKTKACEISKNIEDKERRDEKNRPI